MASAGDPGTPRKYIRGRQQWEYQPELGDGGGEVIWRLRTELGPTHCGGESQYHSIGTEQRLERTDAGHHMTCGLRDTDVCRGADNATLRCPLLTQCYAPCAPPKTPKQLSGKTGNGARRAPVVPKEESDHSSSTTLEKQEQYKLSCR
ncbi:hypothetical protein NDU88_004697 [Pleurodeles waltl]|uniref:Uncharacterized protein n=1 Tax=Pleurodeles waltl TaxID=8319 RepID=A0AAV7UG93_PLEWA|nr:hypothetical protein NDU88_004697 [Pleurodeles waltl]